MGKSGFYICFDDKKVKRLFVPAVDEYEQIAIGDLITFELSKRSKYIFRLDKNGKSLIQFNQSGIG